jgi:hypothetical protein
MMERLNRLIGLTELIGFLSVEFNDVSSVSTYATGQAIPLVPPNSFWCAQRRNSDFRMLAAA